MDYARKRLTGLHRGRDERRPMNNPGDLLVDHDVDMIADERMRHAVADGVESDPHIVGQASAVSLLAAWKRAHWQRPHRHALVVALHRRDVGPLHGALR